MAKIDTLSVTKTANKQYPLWPHKSIEPIKGRNPITSGEVLNLWTVISFTVFDAFLGSIVVALHEK